MIDLNKVGCIFSICRRDKGYTQDELASKLGITPQAISKWERGLSLPDTDMLPSISRMLDISIDNLLMGALPSKDEKQSSADNNLVIPENEVGSMLLPDEILVELSFNLCINNHIFTDGLLAGIKKMRMDFAINHGICLPIVRVRDSTLILENEYKLSFRNKCYGLGRVYRDSLFTVSDDVLLNGISETDFEGHRLFWMNENERLEAGELAYYDAVMMILTHLSHIIINHPDVIITRQMVNIIIDNLSVKHPVLVSEIIPASVSYGRLREILVGIVKEKKPINDMVTILEVIDKSISNHLDNGEIIKELVSIL